jgi:hypothetical protein
MTLYVYLVWHYTDADHASRLVGVFASKKQAAIVCAHLGPEYRYVANSIAGFPWFTVGLGFGFLCAMTFIVLSRGL